MSWESSMRKWYKYVISTKSDEARSALDTTPQEHQESMGGYGTDSGYKNREDFFDTYLYKRPNHQYEYYHEYLARKLRKEETVLSVASGRCINELRLIEDGYNIICSDLEHYTKEAAKRIFPKLQFYEYDVMKGPFEFKVDCVISLGLLYLFDESEMETLFRNIAMSLKPNGRFILDPGGAEDNGLTYCIDELFCRYEQYLRLYTKQKVDKGSITKKHHGYRNRKEEIQRVAEKTGFKILDYSEFGINLECGRSWTLRKLPRSFREYLGKRVPYVRFFELQKV